MTEGQGFSLDSIYEYDPGYFHRKQNKSKTLVSFFITPSADCTFPVMQTELFTKLLLYITCPLSVSSLFGALLILQVKQFLRTPHNNYSLQTSQPHWAVGVLKTATAYSYSFTFFTSFTILLNKQPIET